MSLSDHTSKCHGDRGTFILTPFFNTNNEYHTVMKLELSKILGSPKKLRLNSFLLARAPRTLVLNWLENVTVSIPILGLGIVAGVLFLAKLFRFRIVFVFHNRYPHAAANRRARLTGKFCVWMQKSIADRIVCHGWKTSHDSGSIFYLCHPAYTIDAEICLPPMRGSQKKILAFGSLINTAEFATLLETWSYPHMLVIRGQCREEVIRIAEIAAEKTGGLIDLKSARLKNSDLTDALIDSDAVLVPTTSRQGFVSGVIFHALSAGRPVIILDERMMREVDPRLVGVFASVDEFLTAPQESISPVRIRRQIDRVARGDAWRQNLKEAFVMGLEPISK